MIAACDMFLSGAECWKTHATRDAVCLTVPVVNKMYCGNQHGSDTILINAVVMGGFQYTRENCQ